MLTKLLKHEIKATGRVVPFVYLATAVMALVTYGISQIGIGWLFGLSMVLLILLAITEVILTYVLVVVRYYRNLYGAEGYLMQTLPVRPAYLLISKIVVSFTWFILSYAVLIAVIIGIAASLARSRGLTLAILQTQLLQVTGWQPATLYSLFFVLVGLLLVQALYAMAQFYFAISLGSSARLHKLGLAGPIVVYLITNIVLQGLGVLAMIAVPLGFQMQIGPDEIPRGFRLVHQGMLQSLLHPDETQVIIGTGSYLLGLVMIGVLFGVTAHLLARRTSLR